MTLKPNTNIPKDTPLFTSVAKVTGVFILTSGISSQYRLSND